MHKAIIAILAGAIVTAPVPAVSQSSAVQSNAFWQAIGDTTLTRLIGEALRGSPSAHVAEARVGASRASRTLTAFDLVPTVTGTGSVLRSRQSLAQVPGAIGALPQRDLYDVGFDASWELDLFGRVRRTVNAQNALVESAEHSLDDVDVTLGAEVGRAYFEMRGAQRQLAVALRNGDVQRRTVQLTEDRLAAGRGTAFDVERARSVWQLTVAAVPGLQAQVSTGKNRVAVLLGRLPGAEFVELDAAATLPVLPDTIVIGSLHAVARRRPDVLAAERLLAARGLSVSVARADYLPHVELAASMGYTAGAFQSLTNTGASRVLFGPVVSFPLLDLGRVKQRVRFAAAQQDEARAEYAGTMLRAVEETEDAVVNYNRARERVGILDDAVRSSTHATELAQQRFEGGLTDFLQVLDAQRTLLEAENQLANAHTAAAVALVALYKATGGSWSGGGK